MGSADTGAREPQDSVSALVHRTDEMRARAEHALTAWGEPYRGDGNLRSFTEALARDVVALLDILDDCDRLITAQNEHAETLAAGVAADTGARERQRDLVSALSRALAALAEAVEGDAADRAYAAEFGASEWAAFVPKKVWEPLQAAREALAGVGEARPAEPNDDIRICLQPKHRELEAECGRLRGRLADTETEKIERGTEILRLREQLDAAREALDQTFADVVGLSVAGWDSERRRLGEVALERITAVRAALGVEQ